MLPPCSPRRPERGGRVLPGLLLVCAVLSLAAGGMAARYGRSWPRRLTWPRPPGIILHHSASPGRSGGKPVDVSVLDRWHGERGWGRDSIFASRHVGYHYVILPDGTVQHGRPEWMLGAHCLGHNEWLGICLIGDFSSSHNPARAITPAEPTPLQRDALHDLLTDLLERYHLSSSSVLRHCDVGQTECPGDRFPFERTIERIGNRETSTGETADR